MKSDLAFFEDVVLTDAHAALGELFASDRQRELLERISAEGNPVVYSASTGNVVTTDVYGPMKIQSVGAEDRLHFPKNTSHVHIRWSGVHAARRTAMPGHPAGPERCWIGIEFLDGRGRPLFGIWNLKADREFGDDVYACLGDILEP